jgi:hypothetical protein
MAEGIVSALIGAAATVIAAVVGVQWKKRRDQSESADLSSSPEARKRRHKYDLFVSAPLAALPDDDQLRRQRDDVAKLVELAERQFGFNVYWAARNIRSRADFEAADLSAKRDVDALLDSRYFIMVYPSKIVSSVLFEAGIALRCCLTSIYFVRSNDDLPFLMTQASQAFSNVRTYACPTFGDHLGLLTKHGRSFFEPRQAN